MEKEKIQVENGKQAYDKPVLTKHGNLKEITADILVGSKTASPLGCTRF